jgi:hypothetical protein
MTRRIVFSALALLACASIANAGIVDPEQSWADMVGEPATLLIAPGGAESLVFPDDHTIDIYVNDSGGNPVEIVASDMYLLNDDAEPCPGGWIADSSSFAPDAGHTTMTSVLRGGVPLVAPCTATTSVMAVGNEIQVLDLFFVSPDLNGDGTVGSVDFAVFASCFNQPCVGHCLCADLDKAGGSPCVGSVDFAIFASFYNVSTCP